MGDKEGSRENRWLPGKAIEQAVAAALREKLQSNSDQLARLIELGIVDAAAIDSLPDDLDFAGVLRQFTDRISEMASTEPSVLAELAVRPLEMLTAPAADEPSESEQTHVERAVAFSDLEGFTTFTSERGDTEASALLRDHYEVVEAVVRSRGGAIVKTLGDGHMLSFREPSAAVMSCVDLVAASPAPLRLRAGGHLGSVVRTETDLFGHVVNVAARVTDLAEGGQSMVTVELRDAAGKLPRIEYKEPHSAVLPGLDERVAVCEVRTG
jgi:adenylate cyclase